MAHGRKTHFNIRQTCRELKTEARETLHSMLAIGESKHDLKCALRDEYENFSAEDKSLITEKEYVDNGIRDKIFSIGTLENYEKWCNYFCEYVAERHPEANTLSQARQYVDDFLKYQNKENSAWTAKLAASAVGKMYQEPITNFEHISSRERGEITRSRFEAVRDKHFSVENNKELIDFCKGTGLRRSELEALKPEQLKYDEERERYVLGVTGKGGRYREAEILPQYQETVLNRINNTQPGENVWPRVHNACDVHGYRAEYAAAVYEEYARPLEDLDKKEIYCCANDKSGDHYDREAMKIASENLGHSRVSVIAGHYLR